MGGRPPPPRPPPPSGPDPDPDTDGGGVGTGRSGVGLESRHFASDITPSARESESVRMPVFSCRTVFSPFKDEISAWRAATAPSRLWLCAERACVAEVDCVVFERTVCERALETADWRACFSGLGGMGGGRAFWGGVNVGRSTSNGEVRRSVGSFGCGGCTGGGGAGAGTGPGPGVGCTDTGAGAGAGCCPNDRCPDGDCGCGCLGASAGPGTGPDPG